MKQWDEEEYKLKNALLDIASRGSEDYQTANVVDAIINLIEKMIESHKIKE